MTSTVRNGISLWNYKVEEIITDGIKSRKITAHPVLCDCGYTRAIGGDGAKVASYFYHRNYWLCEGCGTMLDSTEMD